MANATDRHPFDEGIPLDELESQFPEVTDQTDDKPAGTDFSTIKLEGDNVPEHLRGQSVESLIAQNRKMEELMANFGRNNPPPTPVTPPVPEVPVYDRAAIANLVESGNLLEAMEALVGYTYKRATIDFEQRIAPLQNTTLSVAEQSVRQRYPDEFELFGDQIRTLAQQAGPSLTTPQAWDSLIAYVRGTPENFDKLVAHKATKRRPVVEETPNFGGMSLRNPDNRRGGQKMTKEELRNDPNAQKVMRASGMSEDEYLRWF